MEYVPPFAPLVVLAFLALGGSLAITALALLAAAIFRKARLIPWIVGFGAVVTVGYAGVLLADSAVSRERILVPGEKKYFCEIDCHIAYSVEGVETEPTVGPPLEPLRARGRWHVVRLRTWFDPSTTSPYRGDAPLTPNPRVAYVRDRDGKRYEPSPRAQQALASAGRPSTPLTQPLRPGESYETLLAFDLPPDVREPRLYLGEDDAVNFLLIGHEQSPFHRKVWFRI
jgi:hypothetical protein